MVFLSGAVLTLWYQHFNLMEFVENLGLCILIITVGGFFYSSHKLSGVKL